jgi:hypothetical protein
MLDGSRSEDLRSTVWGEQVISYADPGDRANQGRPPGVSPVIPCSRSVSPQGRSSVADTRRAGATRSRYPLRCTPLHTHDRRPPLLEPQVATGR